MIKHYLEQRARYKKLSKKLIMLEAQKEQLQIQLNKTQKANSTNSRRSDRKFKENSTKALSARNKRANKSGLREIEYQIKFTKTQLSKASEYKKMGWKEILFGSKK